MKTLIGLVVMLLVCALANFGVLGCNTFRGAGKDIQKGGKAVENAAENAQEHEGHPRPHSITASAESGGAISPSGSISVPYGANRTYTIRAFRGYHVADVLVDGKSMGAVRRQLFENVTANHTISALFTPDPIR